MTDIKKIKKYFLIVLVCIFVYLIIDLILFNIKIDNKKSNTVRINYIVTDYDKTKKSNFDVFSTYGDAIVYMYTSTVELKKENGYYITTAKDINVSFFENVVNSTFALNDVEGNIIKDASYDKKTRKIKIPSKYFSAKNMKNYKNVPVKLELISRVKKDKYTYNKIPLKMKKLISTKKYVYTNRYNDYPEFSIFKYKKGKYINESDFKIYINGNKEPVSKKLYSYDRKTGVVKLKFYPYYINNIEVKFSKMSLVKNKLFSILFFYKDVEAAKKVKATTTFTATENKRSESFMVHDTTTSTVEYYYRHGDGTYRYGNGSSVTDVASSATIEGIFDNAIGVSTAEPAAYQDFAVKVGTLTFSKNFTYEVCDDNGENCETKNGTAKLTVAINKWLLMWCYHTGAKADVNGNLKIKFTVSSYSNGVYTITAEATEAVANQTAKGEFDVVGDNPANLILQKKMNDTGTPTDSATRSIVFRLYKDRSNDPQKGCEGLIAQKVTNGSGKAVFNGLKANTSYCIKEIFKESSSNSAFKMVDYYRDASCDGVQATEYNHNDGDKVKMVTTGAAGTTVGPTGTEEDPYKYSYCNVTKRYTTAIKKVDADTGANLAGFTFGLKNTAYSTVTDGNGYGQICGIPTYQSYVFTENAQAAEYWGSTGEVTVNAPKYEYGGQGSGEWLPDYDGTKTNTAYNTILHPYPINAACPSILGQETGTFQNTHKFYCIKIKKVDADDESKLLSGATFQADGTGVSLTRNSQMSYQGTSPKTAYRESNGITTILTADHKETFKITETEAPAGYAKSSQTPYATPTLISTSKKWSEIDFSDCDASLSDSDASVITMKNTSLTINWYKVSETNNTKISGAQFKVKKGTATIYHEEDKKISTDANGIQKSCYVASATSTGDGSDIFVADDDGEVCVRGIEEGTYTVTETLPGQYHAFGKYTSKDITTSSTFVARDDSENESNKFVNVPTGFRFTKTVKADDGADNDDKKIVINGEEKSITKLNSEELKKIDFEVYVADANGNPTGNPLKFIKNDETGIYEYSEDQTQTIHGTTGTVVSILHLDDNRQIAIDHLPWDSSTHEKKYVIREVQSKVCDSTKSEEDCIGYYYPDYKAQASTFTITPCSYDKDIVNATSCPTGGFATQTLQNTPTLFEFTKKDLYGYDDQADVQDKNRDKDESETTVEFENDKERSDFDRIDFRVKDSNGNYMNFIYMGNSGSCTDPNSYSIYKYVPGLQLPDGVAADVFNNTELGITQTVHACGGHIHFTNLCRGNTYTVYEDEVPSDSVFVRETVQEEPKTSVSTTIPCTEKENQEKTSSTAIISDKPTYFEVQKRDSKYNYLIPDEAATFRLYQCEKGTECHPTDVADDPTTEEDERLTATNVRRVIKFYDRGVLVNSENQNINEETSKDHENSEGDLLDVQVYRAMSDSDVDNNTNYVTDVHPYLGRLVFRYLQSGYNYVLVETRAPKNYMLPIGQSAETKFTVVSTTVDVEAKDTPNVPTSLLIRKYDKDGDKLLAGAEFKIYKAQNQCNFNQNPWSQVGLKEVKLKTIRDGVYEARPETDTSTIRTCLDKEGALCSEIPTNTQTRLTDLEYAVGSETANEEDTWADFENILYKSEENGVTKTEKINLQEGEALVQYLEYGNCYVIEETKAPTGYSLPKKKKDRFTMVQIDDNEQYGHDTSKIFKNTPTPFTFFKYDEFNQPLDGAEFKLQKLNDDKKYEDIAVTEEEKEGELFYKYEGLAEENSNTVMHTNGGKATVYYLPVGQYRIVETKAAPGKELTKNPNIATFFVDDAGNTFGNALVVNKAETKKIIPKNSASAELIVNIQTGQVVIRYGSIILTIVGLIIGLMLLKKKTK